MILNANLILYRVYIYIDRNMKNSFYAKSINLLREYITAQKMKFSIKDFFSKCDQIRSFIGIWSHLLKKFLMEVPLFLEYI